MVYLINNILKPLVDYFIELFCSHKEEDIVFIRNIYGEEIVMKRYMRSEWQCKNCGRFIYKPFLWRPDDK